MDIKDIKTIYKFLRDTDIVEFELEGKEGRVKIRRGSVSPASDVFAAPQLSEPVGPAKVAVAEAPVVDKKSENIKVMTSPMVGTFYRAASPEAPAFVEVGTTIKSGQALCIIEAMKLMNEVESEFSGKIVSILVENGQPVEYGEPLFHVEVSK